MYFIANITFVSIICNNSNKNITLMTNATHILNSPETPFMTATEKIIALQDMTGVRPAQFAAIVGISPSTMSRIRSKPAKHEVSDEILGKLADAFEEIDLTWLTDPTVATLPATLTPVRGTLPEADMEAEGEQLRRYMGRNLIKQRQLAETMGISHVQINHYLKSKRFRRDVLDSLLDALTKIKHRPVMAAEIFGSARLAPTSDSVVAIPRLNTSARAGLTPESLTALHTNFMPALRRNTAFYVPKENVPESLMDAAYALEIGSTDHMGELRPGFLVLALAIPESDWISLHDGNVAVLTTSGQFMVKRIVRNALRAQGTIELTSPERGGTITLAKEDIAVLFHLTRIVDGAL